MPPGKKVSSVEIRRLHEEGKSSDEIAEILGVTRQTIWRNKRRLGIEMRISMVRLENLIQQGKDIEDIARELGVDRQTVLALMRRKKLAITKDIALRSAPQVLEKNLNAIEQLQKINDYANELLDLLMRWGRGDEEALQILESQVATKKVRVGKKVEFVKEFKMKDPRELALKAMAEIRGQLNLQLELFKCLYDIEAVKQFQEEVLSAINEVSPEVRDRILHKLTERRAIRSTIDFPGRIS